MSTPDENFPILRTRKMRKRRKTRTYRESA
jgi:hypothetical protein